MANETRDRLVELIQANPYIDVLYDSQEEWEDAADYLIENGVIVPPCKVGQTVYVIEPCTCFNGYRTFEECHHRRTKATKWVDVVMVKNRHHNRCMKLFERPYKPEYIFKVGKTVFLTKSESEQKLKEMRGADNG
jgi:hypothetical protein